MYIKNYHFTMSSIITTIEHYYSFHYFKYLVSLIIILEHNRFF